MDSLEIFKTALEYEKKIRDLYLTADRTVDDPRGKAIFKALADDEQSHVDFLLYSMEQLQNNSEIDLDRLNTPIPSPERIAARVHDLEAKIPQHMLGDIKTVLSNALQVEKDTSTYYKGAAEQTEGEIRKIFEKFLEIEERHVEVVRIELDHAMHNGMWFDFMEVNLEELE